MDVSRIGRCRGCHADPELVREVFRLGPMPLAGSFRRVVIGSGRRCRVDVVTAEGARGSCGRNGRGPGSKALAVFPSGDNCLPEPATTAKLGMTGPRRISGREGRDQRRFSAAEKTRRTREQLSAVGLGKAALTTCYRMKERVVAAARIELATRGFSIRCSTN